MTWAEAMRDAAVYGKATKRRIRVRAYRDADGRWQYALYPYPRWTQ